MAATKQKSVETSNPCETCAVRVLSLCAPLVGPELDRINRIVSRAHFAAEGAIFHEGDPADAIYSVTTGCIRLSKLLPDGRRQITGFLMPGDFFGLAYDAAYTYTAEAVTAVDLCRISRDKLEALTSDMPKLEHRLLTMAASELIVAQDQMMVLGRKRAEERLATFLLSIAKRSGRAARPEDPVEIPMSRADIADHLGLTVETVSRAFTGFRNSGLLILDDPRRIRIADRKHLEALAAGDAA